MSSFVRTLQRSAKREVYYRGRGSKVGAPPNLKAADLLARQRREAVRAAAQGKMG